MNVSQNIKRPSGQESGDDSKKYISGFTGEALVEIVAVNPTPEEIHKITGRDLNSINETQYVGVTDKNGNEYTNLTFLLKFTPSDKLKETVKKDYIVRDGYFVNYTIPVYKEFSISNNRDKIQVIDDRNLSTWVPYEENKTAKELFENHMNTIMKNDPDSKQMGYLKLFNPVTVRFAHKGEVHLMDFIFNATWLLRHNTEIKSKKEGDEPEIIKLENFVLSETSSSPQEASAAFEKIVEGNIAYLKEILASEICQDDEKNPMKIGVLLGMSVDEGTNRAYMRVFNPRLSCSTFKMKARSQRKMIKSVITECRFNKETIENLNSEKYPWDCWFNADLILSPFYMDSYKAPESSVEDSGSPFPFIPKYLSNDGDPDDNKKKSDDDLPF